MPDEARRHARLGMQALLADLGPPLVGVTSLAAGADQLFAETVHVLGGRLHVIIPSRHYGSTFVNPSDRDSYRRLLARADTVDTLAFAQPSEEAFFAAGKAVVDASDLMCAVWDGMPAQGVGGSADVVSYARSRAKVVEVIWPKGLSR